MLIIVLLDCNKLMQDQGSKFETFANKTLDDSMRWEVSIYVHLNSVYVKTVYFVFSLVCNILVSTQDIQWLRSITTLPILIKGILTHEDGKV